MFIAGAARTMMFMVATVGQIIVGLYVLGYAAHCFLVILEDTAAGNDEVVWPDVPLTDWLGKIIYLTCLAAFWFIPAWLLLDLVAPAALGWFPGVPVGVLVVGIVWLVFPVSLFSSLSASPRWVVFRLEALRRLLHHLPALLVVYCVTGVLLAGWAFLSYVTFAKYLFLLPVVACLGPAVLFIDARLLGRLAWLANFRTPERHPEEEAPAEKPISSEDPWADPQPAKPKKKKKGSRKKSSTAYDPWAVPEEEPPREKERPVSLPVEGYGLAEEEAPPAPRPASSPRQSEEETLGLQPLPPESPAAKDEEPKPEPLADLTRVSEYEAALAGGGKEPEPPPFPLWSGVYNFPWYPRCVGPWLWLVFGLLVMGLLLKLQMEFWPGG
jgi:hypothetical protein